MNLGVPAVISWSLINPYTCPGVHINCLTTSFKNHGLVSQGGKASSDSNFYIGEAITWKNNHDNKQMTEKKQC